MNIRKKTGISTFYLFISLILFFLSLLLFIVLLSLIDQNSSQASGLSLLEIIALGPVVYLFILFLIFGFIFLSIYAIISLLAEIDYSNKQLLNSNINITEYNKLILSELIKIRNKEIEQL